MIPEFGWLSDQGQGKKFIKLSFSHKHSVNCQTLHDDTTHSVDLFKIPFHIFCDLEHISRLQQHQTVWGENYCISYKWCLHGSFDFLSVLHWLQRAPPAIHYVAYFSFEDICKDLGGKYSFHGTSQRTLRQLSSLGIRLNSLLLQLHIITNPKSFIRSPSCHSCFSPFQWSFRLNRLNQKIEVGYHVGTQTTVTKCATSRVLTNQCVWVAHNHIYSSWKHHM